MATPTVQAAQPRADRRLELAQILSDLVADGLVPKDAADQLVANRRFARSDTHPLAVIADQKWKDPRNPKKLLHLEALTQWLAEKVELPYLHPELFKDHELTPLSNISRLQRARPPELTYAGKRV